MSTPRKPSLFAQRLHNPKEMKRKGVGASESTYQNNVETFSCFGDKSNIVSSPNAELIHQDNLTKLASMSRNEIENERQNLLTTMDPSVIAFLKSRKTSSSGVTNTLTNSEGCESSTDSSPMELSSELLQVEKTPARHLVNKFAHMDVVEPEKLLWMQDVPPPKPPPQGCPYNARFNFEGELLPYSEADVKPVDVGGLYNHGEEPERPGYTLQELIQLSRSSMLQQRITALSTLANIFHKAGDYDYCLDKPLMPELLNSELYLLLRFSLDDPVRSVVSAAIAAVASLLVNAKDEGCLDRLLGLSIGLRQPSLYVHLDLKPTELAELKDTELLKVDVIRGALRTHLLPRFRYILIKLDPDPVEISHMMRCLIRIARHSLEAALSVSNAPGLLTAIRKLLNEPPPVACSEALKLFRVLACQSRSLAALLVDHHDLLGPVQRFIAGGRDESTMSLALESLYTWQTLISYHLAISYIPGFTPVVQRLLVTYADSISLDSAIGDLTHATALVAWFSCVVRVDVESVRSVTPALQLCALKWLSQATLVHESCLKWPACKLLEAILQAIASLIKLQVFKNNEIERKVQQLMQSENFSHLSQKLRKHSWLLCGENNPSVVESLPCLGAVPPTLYDDSPVPLVRGLAVYAYALQSPQLSEVLAYAEGTQRYLEEVVTVGVRNTAAHWYARQEIVIIYTLLQIHLNMQNPLERSTVHQVALFLSSAIHSDDRYMLTVLFKQVIFNKHFFRPEISDITSELENLQLNAGNQQVPSKRSKLLNEALDSLETICSCYLRELGLEGLTPVTPPITLTASANGTDPAIPADWPFQPAVHLNNIDGKREDAVSVATSCLQWILVLESFRPNFVANISPAARYCRLACVLLAGNDLFQDVRELLQGALHALLSHNENMSFSKEIPGLKSFYDFYRQILEQFVGVSYGDPVFGQFVLIPLQQRHSLRLKKLMWCELSAALRFLSTPVDQIGVPLINFLEPCETDLDMLLIYLRALAQGRVRETFSPVLFRVAVHHVASFISRHRDQPAARRLAQMVDALGNVELKSLLNNYCGNPEHQ